MVSSSSGSASPSASSSSSSSSSSEPNSLPLPSSVLPSGPRPIAAKSPRGLGITIGARPVRDDSSSSSSSSPFTSSTPTSRKYLASSTHTPSCGGKRPRLSATLQTPGPTTQTSNLPSPKPTPPTPSSAGGTPLKGEEAALVNVRHLTSSTCTTITGKRGSTYGDALDTLAARAPPRGRGRPTNTVIRARRRDERLRSNLLREMRQHAAKQSGCSEDHLPTTKTPRSNVATPRSIAGTPHTSTAATPRSTASTPLAARGTRKGATERLSAVKKAMPEKKGMTDRKNRIPGPEPTLGKRKVGRPYGSKTRQLSLPFGSRPRPGRGEMERKDVMEKNVKDQQVNGQTKEPRLEGAEMEDVTKYDKLNEINERLSAQVHDLETQLERETSRALELEEAVGLGITIGDGLGEAELSRLQRRNDELETATKAWEHEREALFAEKEAASRGFLCQIREAEQKMEDQKERLGWLGGVDGEDIACKLERVGELEAMVEAKDGEIVRLKKAMEEQLSTVKRMFVTNKNLQAKVYALRRNRE